MEISENDIANEAFGGEDSDSLNEASSSNIGGGSMHSGIREKNEKCLFIILLAGCLI